MSLVPLVGSCEEEKGAALEPTPYEASAFRPGAAVLRTSRLSSASFEATLKKGQVTALPPPEQRWEWVRGARGAKGSESARERIAPPGQHGADCVGSGEVASTSRSRSLRERERVVGCLQDEGCVEGPLDVLRVGSRNLSRLVSSYGVESPGFEVTHGLKERFGAPVTPWTQPRQSAAKRSLASDRSPEGA